MTKKDKEFGEHKGTCVLCGSCSIRRYQKGFTLKPFGKELQRIPYDRDTTYKDLSNEVEKYRLENP